MIVYGIAIHKFIIIMKPQSKNKDFSKSMKYFHTLKQFQYENVGHVPARTSVDKKIDLLRIPVYDRKKILKKSQNLLINGFEKQKTESKKKDSNIVQQLKTDENDVFSKSHYRHRSTHSRKTFQSWFRRTSSNLQQTKNNKNIVDIVIMQKQIERDAIPNYERNSSTMNLRDRPSKSLINQDSQSLLRKNSLYLLNFIKRQQNRNKQVEPHIGGIPNTATNMRIVYSPTKCIKYTPKHENRPKRPQKIISTFSKIISSMPIDPW